MRAYLKKAFWGLAIIFLLLNAVAFIHAYKFTHFKTGNVPRTKDIKELTILDKTKILLTGIDNPKPQAIEKPKVFESVTLSVGDDTVKCWSIKAHQPKGIVILFHGYAGEKSSLLGRSNHFLKLGYNVLLVDFVGSGESSGSTTSVGFNEATQVKACFDYCVTKGETNILLFGTSMGSVAILKSIHKFTIQPAALILECPFGSLYNTVCARFTLMGIPSFPMAGLLTFWGGVQNGYWAFSHNPIEYAKAVKCPALLLFGKLDDRVNLAETNSICTNFQGHKMLKIYPNEGHQLFTTQNKTTWQKDVSDFIEGHFTHNFGQ